VHSTEFPAEHWPHAPVGSQAGVLPPQSLSPPQARQVRNDGSQMGVVPPQSALARQPTQLFVDVLQTGVAPPHWLELRHCTQVAVLVSQTAVVPVHWLVLVAEHWPQAPDAWQAGVAPLQSLSPPQARQAWVPPSQIGVVPPQFAFVRQATQTLGDALVRQYGVAPLQSALCEH